MDAEVVSLDVSDDSDNLPSFRERVQRLIESETRKVDNNPSHKKRIPYIHAISDSDDSDSLEIITNMKVTSSSPVKCLLDIQENGFCMNSDDDEDLPDLRVILGSTYKKEHDHVLGSGILETENLADTDHEPQIKISKIPRETRKSPHKSLKSREKEIQKEQRLKIREEKKKEREFVKALKVSEKEILKSQKPEEFLKSMKIVVDHNILSFLDSQHIFHSLDENNLKYSVEENVIKNSIMWYRTVTNIAVDNQNILKEEKEDLVNVLLLMIPNEDFLKMIYAFIQKSKGKNTNDVSLTEYIATVNDIYAEMEITCGVVGFEKYIRNIKEQDNSALKVMAKQVHKNSIEQALVELQLQTFINFHFLDNMSEFGNLLCHFSKSISEKPLRKEKELQKSQFSWYADMDSNCPVKLANDGSGFIKLWKQQIQQFQNVGPEVAEAIASRYPSPRLLLKAYKSCASTKEAEMLLQDIVVRRNYGPLGTQKRIGPELSFKLHTYFTSRNGSQLLKR